VPIFGHAQLGKGRSSYRGCCFCFQQMVFVHVCLVCCWQLHVQPCNQASVSQDSTVGFLFRTGGYSPCLVVWGGAHANVCWQCDDLLAKGALRITAISRMAIAAGGSIFDPAAFRVPCFKLTPTCRESITGRTRVLLLSQAEHLVFACFVLLCASDHEQTSAQVACALVVSFHQW
jgi:hypothetical protein